MKMRALVIASVVTLLFMASTRAVHAQEGAKSRVAGNSAPQFTGFECQSSFALAKSLPPNHR